MHPLITADYSCDEHSDCTVTVYSNDLGDIGRRHLHQWVDPVDAPAIDGRGRGDVVIGALNVGVLYDYDPETGIADFDPVATVLTSSMHSEDAPSRLNLDYPWANDLRDGSKCVFVMPSDAEARKLGLSGADLDEFKATVASKQPATRKLDKPPKR